MYVLQLILCKLFFFLNSSKTIHSIVNKSRTINNNIQKQQINELVHTIDNPFFLIALLILNKIKSRMVSAFSMPHSKRDEKYSTNPGPGQYNPQNAPKTTKKKEPEYSLGKQKRELKDENGVPGPGTYDSRLQKSNIEPSYSFGMKVKEVTEKINLGPGSYVPKYKLGEQNSPSFSFKKKSRSVVDQMVPGPGNYEPYQSSVVVDHIAKFSHQKRDLDLSEKFPGPGSYEYRQAFDRYAMKNEPKYNFGSKIPQLKASQVPGPGSYSNKKEIYSKIGGIMSRDIRFSMGKSIDLGPGISPVFSLAKSKRYLEVGNYVPGPGEYESPQSYKKFLLNAPTYQFSKERRLKLQNTEFPGPGSYISKQQFTKKNIYIPQRVKLPEEFNVPGPGSYKLNEDIVTNNNIKYSLGKNKRDQDYNNKVPGPGSYTVKFNNGSNTLNYGFGSEQKMKSIVSKVPGPGSYNLKSPFADLPHYAMLNNKINTNNTTNKSMLQN